MAGQGEGHWDEIEVRLQQSLERLVKAAERMADGIDYLAELVENVTGLRKGGQQEQCLRISEVGDDD